MNFCYWNIFKANTVINWFCSLYEASSRMRAQLVEASEIQGIVLEGQREGLRIQNELLDHGKELGNVIKSSAETVSGMVVDFK